MKWTRLLPPISIILSGILTASIKVVTGYNSKVFMLVVNGVYDFPAVVANSVVYNGVEYPVFTYSKLPYLIGALLIFAGGLMLYNEIKEMRHENKET